MKRLEIIRKIIEETPSSNISGLLLNNNSNNLALLCISNEKYLTEENVEFIFNHDEYESKYKQLYSHISFFDKERNREYYSPTALLISKYPKLFKKLSNERIKNFKIDDWIKILQEQPKLISECKIINKFRIDDKFTILDKHPDLFFEYKKFHPSNPKYLSLKRSCLIKMIKKFPDNLKKFSSEIFILTTADWLKILQKQPQLLSECKLVDFFKNCPNELVELVSEQPKLSYFLPSIKKLSGYQMLILISKRPEFIEELKLDLSKLDRDYWKVILERQPQLIDKCNKIDDFSSSDWYDLLNTQPKLIDKCKDTKIMTIGDRINLLKLHIELIGKMHIENLDDNLEILYNSKEHNVELMEKYIKNNNNSEFLTNMIGIYPNLKTLYTKRDLWKYVDFSKLTDNLEYSILK